MSDQDRKMNSTVGRRRPGKSRVTGDGSCIIHQSMQFGDCKPLST